MKDSLTIAIPLYNEEESVKNLHFVLTPIIERLQSERSINTILVNDGSTDNTKKLL